MSDSFWSRRNKAAKVTIIVIGSLIVLTAVGSALPSSEKGAPERAAQATSQASPTPTATETPTPQDASPVSTETPTPEPTPEPEPTPAQPSPRTVTGVGQLVKTLRLRATGALLVKGTHQGSSNFIVDLVPRGGDEFDSHNLYNEIGSYSGQTVIAYAGKGRYRVKVNADGPWKLSFSQPSPPQNARSITKGTIRGTGAKVVKVHADDDMQLLVNATHRGESNFIAELVPYGPDAGDAFLGTQSLFNEIGNFKGESLVEQLGYGDYLLHVQADGAWTFKFRE
jgi:hypothetical protein